MNVLGFTKEKAKGGNLHSKPWHGFKRERATEGLFQELAPMLQMHWKEVAHFHDIELNPDYAMYLAMEAINVLRIFTARTENGELVGYAAYLVRHNLHYKQSKQAVQDVVFIDPRHRGFGEEFLSWCDKELKGEGVEVVYHHVKVAHNWGPMLERLGYTHVEHIYARRFQ